MLQEVRSDDLQSLSVVAVVFKHVQYEVNFLGELVGRRADSSSAANLPLEKRGVDVWVMARIRPNHHIGVRWLPKNLGGDC